MIGLDTNVVVRYLVQDNVDQATRATAVMESLTADDPGFLSAVAIVELVWVLRSSYGFQTGACLELIDGFLDARELRVQASEIVRRALGVARGGVDFADAMIAEFGRSAGCADTVTFDRRAARLGAMRLLDR